MTLYDAYRNTDYLDDVSFIAGSNFTLYFEIYDSNNVAVDINASTIKWALSPYGQPDQTILQINDFTISGTNTFVVELEKEDTINLGGVYIQQIEITDFYGNQFRPAQGIVIIRKAITLT